MWDVGNKTFDVAQPVRRNQSSSDRMNRPSLSPPPPPAVHPKRKKKGLVGKTVVAALLLVVPNPMRSSSLDSAVTPSYAVSEIPQRPPGPRPEIPVGVDEATPLTDWDDLMLMVPDKPEVEEKPAVEPASAPKVVGEPITVREIYITPPLLGRSVFDTVGD